MRDPGITAGAHETELQPIAWPLKILAPQVPSAGVAYECSCSRSTGIRGGPYRCYVLLNVKTESLPSEEAHATIAPSSWGAQLTELTKRQLHGESLCFGSNEYVM